MIKRTFEYDKPYRCVAYGRMSSEEQNPRSPDQQFQMIELEISRRKLPWTVVKRYRDDGKSGRYFQKRPGLQEMLADIRSRRIAVDLLLLDTRERLGRNDELAPLRKELLQQHGVLILTVDSGFIDPTTTAGEALAVVDEFRARQDNRTKSHQVARGKLDLALRKFWPGGKPPRGLQQKIVFAEVNGRQERIGSILVPEPEFAPVVRLVFQRAADTGEGQTRVARFITESPEVPNKFKPMPASTVGYIFNNELYIGEFRFPKHCTDIVDDTLVREPNKAENIFVITEFCEPIVSRDVWDRVQAVRDARRAAIAATRSASEEDGKHIKPLAPGISVKNLLSGLARCGHCGSAMVVGGSSPKKDPSGKYAYFYCPRRLDGGCTNKKSVSANWLTDTVISHVTEQLFGSAS